MDEPRRPWVDADQLRSKFLARSSQSHPDRFHGAQAQEQKSAHDDYTVLNRAYNCLRDSRERCRHLLELEGHKTTDLETLPAAAMDMAMEVGRLCRGTDAYLAAGAAITSPILRAQRFAAGQGWLEKLQTLQRQLQDEWSALEEHLKELNAHWEKADGLPTPKRGAGLPLTELDQIQRQLGYLSRWRQQIQERIVGLAA